MTTVSLFNFENFSSYYTLITNHAHAATKYPRYLLDVTHSQRRLVKPHQKP